MSASVHGSQHSDKWLDQVFSAVQLPSVKNREIQYKHINAEQESVLAELDEVLQKQSLLSDSSKIYANTPENDESNHFYDDVPDENHYDTISEVPFVSQQPIVSSHRHQTFSSLAAEETDKFPEGNQSLEPDSLVLRHLQPRSRCMTIDSQVSAAESRFASFDLHDENSHDKNSKINLFHNEVAYIRPKKLALKEMPRGESESVKTQVSRQHSGQSAGWNSINTYSQQASVTNSRHLSASSIAKFPNERASQIAAINGVHKPASTSNGLAFYGDPEVPIEFNDTAIEHLKSGTLLHEIADYGIVQPAFDEYCEGNFQHFVVGNYGQSMEEEKTILLLGESGVGKTTFIYSALNYLYGVEKEYDFRFAIESPNQIKPTNAKINVYTFCNTVLGQKVTIVDTPGIEKDHTVGLIQKWVKFQLGKKSQQEFDGVIVFERHDQQKFNNRVAAKYSRLEELLGGDIRALTVLAYTFANHYATDSVPEQKFPNLPFFIDNYLLFNSAGFFPITHNLQQLIHFKTSVASFDELFFALNYKLHPVVLARRQRTGTNALKKE